MKIVFLDKLSYPYSGIQDYLFDLITLLEAHHHSVILFDGNKKVQVTDIQKKRFMQKTRSAGFFHAVNVLEYFQVKHKFEQLVMNEKPDIIHINNLNHVFPLTYLLIAKKYHIPVIYHIHDYKLICPIYKLFRAGKPCRLCKNKKFFHAVVNGCSLRDKPNFFESLYVFIESTLHHTVYHAYEMVDAFISSSLFVEKVHREMGFEGTMYHIPHFVSGSSMSQKELQKKRVIYFGRIVSEKGLKTLIQAVEHTDIELRIIGSGRQEVELKNMVAHRQQDNVSFLGFLDKDAIQQEISRAYFCIVPSLWEEPFGKSIIESFSFGIPAVGSKIGGIPELIKEGFNGFLFRSGDVRDLREKILLVMHLSQKNYEAMCGNAYSTWKEKFSPLIHYKKLMGVYDSVLKKGYVTNLKKDRNRRVT